MVKESVEVRNGFIGVEKLFTVVMQDTLEHVFRDRFDFMGAFCLCKGFLDSSNDFSFLFGSEEVIKATEKGNVLKRQGPSHFLNQRDVRLPLQERAEVFTHALS